jgi:hypothetical protein
VVGRKVQTTNLSGSGIVPIETTKLGWLACNPHAELGRLRVTPLHLTVEPKN